MTAIVNTLGESTGGEFRIQMRSEERRIESQHEHLDFLCQELYSRIDKDGATQAIDEFVLFMTAFDAHMTVEEDIFFPVLYGLRADLGPEFETLVAEHAEFRIEAAKIQDRLRANDRDAARLALDRLARRISKHERIEENLLTRITEGPMAEFGHSGLGG
jgi:hypothetical protein